MGCKIGPFMWQSIQPYAKLTRHIPESVPDFFQKRPGEQHIVAQ